MPYNSHRLYPLRPEMYSVRGCATKKIQFSLKHPVAMNSIFPGTFPPSSLSIINYGCSSCILLTNQDYALLVVRRSSSNWSSFPLRSLAKFPAHKIDTCHIMGTPQNIRRGMGSSRSARLEPQSAWDSFLLAVRISEVSKGGSYLRPETMISHRVKAKVEEVVPKGRTLEDMPP